jgi:hypothetical protein
MATPLTATPIPAYTALPDVPADLTSLANNLEKFVVTRWATPTARDTAITVPVEGMLAYTNDTDTLWKYTGSVWLDVADRTDPAALVTQLVTQSLANSTFTAITFTVESYKTHTGLHSTSSNTSRLVLGTVPGTWLVSGQINFQGTSATGSRRVLMNLNGVNIASSYTQTGAGPTTGANPFTSVSVAPQIVTAAVSTDYVELQAYQDSGAALSTQVTGGAVSSFTAVRIGP